jgi:hypothetical protein
MAVHGEHDAGKHLPDQVQAEPPQASRDRPVVGGLAGGLRLAVGEVRAGDAFDPRSGRRVDRGGRALLQAAREMG